MLLDRLHISLALNTLTSLTIGTGGRVPVDDDDPDKGTRLEIHRDGSGAACIPATSLKGALRAQLDDTCLCEDFFGDVSDKDENGVTGRLMIYAATLDSQASEPASPIKSSPLRRGEACEFDRPATAIDRDTGAVAHNKLFTMRALAPGSVFRVDMTLHGDYTKADAKVDIANLGKALAPLRDGVKLGKGGRLGGGDLVLHETPTITMVRFDAAKGFVPEQKTDLAKQLKAAIAGAPAQAGKAAATLSFTIVADAPFFISDPSSGEINASVQLAALEDSAGRPVIWPSSLMGVLRSRAAWLAEIERLRAKDAAVYTPKKRNPDHPADDRDLAHIFGSRRAVERKSDVASLSSVERLFGVAGWKGLINVASLTLDPSAQGQPVKLTSVKIDRLSGGVIDGALFTTRAFAGARFNVRLIVNCSGRGWIEAERLKQDLGLLRALGEDLEKRGLEIGHASARGFGWCGVENVQFEEAPQ